MQHKKKRHWAHLLLDLWPNQKNVCGMQEVIKMRTHPCFALLGWWCEHHTIEPIWEELEYHFEEVWFLFQLEKSDKKGVPFELVSSSFLFVFCPLGNKLWGACQDWNLVSEFFHGVRSLPAPADTPPFIHIVRFSSLFSERVMTKRDGHLCYKKNLTIAWKRWVDPLFQRVRIKWSDGEYIHLFLYLGLRTLQ